MLQHDPHGCLVEEFVELSFDFVENSALRSELTDELALLTDLPAEKLMASPRLFFDLACAKLILECYPLITHDPGVCLTEYDSFEREFFVNASVDRFLQRYEDYIGSPELRDLRTRHLREEDRCHFPEQQIELFRDYLVNRGVHELVRIVLGRLARTLHADIEIDTDLCLTVAVLIIGTHFSNFWAAALTVDRFNLKCDQEPAVPNHATEDATLKNMFPRIHI